MPALALLKFGPVHLQDAEGFDVTERSTVGAGSYTYWLASAGNMSSSVRRLYPPVSSLSPRESSLLQSFSQPRADELQHHQGPLALPCRILALCSWSLSWLQPPFWQHSLLCCTLHCHVASSQLCQPRLSQTCLEEHSPYQGLASCSWACLVVASLPE